MARYIDANEFKREMEKYLPEDREIALKVLKSIKTADVVERKKGKWETEIRTIRGHKIPFFACSVCGKSSDDEYTYCPHCGSEMR